jgi:class 3 adenylate cyclase
LRRRQALRQSFDAHGGVEVDTQGDAFFYAFPSAVDALAAAGAAQAALAGGPIRVRMGLHTGTPSRTAEGYVGLDVHLGARVARPAGAARFCSRARLAIGWTATFAISASTG